MLKAVVPEWMMYRWSLRGQRVLAMRGRGMSGMESSSSDSEGELFADSRGGVEGGGVEIRRRCNSGGGGSSAAPEAGRLGCCSVSLLGPFCLLLGWMGFHNVFFAVRGGPSAPIGGWMGFGIMWAWVGLSVLEAGWRGSLSVCDSQCCRILHARWACMVIVV